MNETVLYYRHTHGGILYKELSLFGEEKLDIRRCCETQTTSWNQSPNAPTCTGAQMGQ